MSQALGRVFCRRLSFLRNDFTSLQFGVFLFVFAYFLAFAPAPYLRASVAVATDSAAIAGQAFTLLADGVNEQVSSLVATQIKTAESFGAALAFVGETAGDATALLITHPESLRAAVPAALAAVR